LTFVEASARGLPIVSTRHNGIPEVVLDEQTGYLVPEGDVDAMAQRIMELAKDPSLWSTMGRAGRAHVEEGFVLDRQVARTLEILEASARR
jgi:colanic acid/amylovoran biosynthesis glycosyltransferase